MMRHVGVNGSQSSEHEPSFLFYLGVAGSRLGIGFKVTLHKLDSAELHTSLGSQRLSASEEDMQKVHFDTAWDTHVFGINTKDTMCKMGYTTGTGKHRKYTRWKQSASFNATIFSFGTGILNPSK